MRFMQRFMKYKMKEDIIKLCDNGKECCHVDGYLCPCDDIVLVKDELVPLANVKKDMVNENVLISKAAMDYYDIYYKKKESK